MDDHGVGLWRKATQAMPAICRTFELRSALGLHARPAALIAKAAAGYAAEITVQTACRIRRIAVVDGDPRVCRVAGRALESGGFASETYTSAAGFMAARPWERCDLLVTGVQASAMDGPQLLEHLLGQNVSVPVLMLTGSQEPAQRGRALATEAMSFLEKGTGFIQ